MRATILIAFVASVAASKLAAQWQTVPPGSRVRVSLTGPKAVRVRGTLVATIRDTVAMQAQTGRFLRPGPEVPRAYPLAGLGQLDVSDGTARLKGALQGAATGAVFSLAFGGLVWTGSKLGGGGIYRQQTKVSGWRSATTASMALVPIGALIRGVNAPEKWRRVYPTP